MGRLIILPSNCEMLRILHLGLKRHEISSVHFGMSTVVGSLRSFLGGMLLGFLGYSVSAIARKYFMVPLFLSSFCPLFHDGPSALGTAVVLKMY